jgi:hypothetical protein
MRQGPVPAAVHGLVEYVAGFFLVAAPFLFGFDSDAAMAFSIMLGLGILIVAASSEMPTGLAKAIPVGIHVVLDLAVVAVLIASPFLFGFSDETAPTAIFIVLGVVHLLLTIGTRFKPAVAAR